MTLSAGGVATAPSKHGRVNTLPVMSVVGWNGSRAGRGPRAAGTEDGSSPVGAPLNIDSHELAGLAHAGQSVQVDVKRLRLGAGLELSDLGSTPHSGENTSPVRWCPVRDVRGALALVSI